MIWNLPDKLFVQLKYSRKKGPQGLAVGLGLAAVTTMALFLGVFQPVELGILDQFFRLRSFPKVSDSRILVVTIGEDEIEQAGQWPISDEMLADLITKISVHDPAGIGLDLYRNFPVDPGSTELVEVFEATPNIVGIERVIGESVAGHRTLIELGQTAAADLVVDDDGVVRRGLLSVISPDGDIKQGLAATLSLSYLEALNVVPEFLDPLGLSLKLGVSRINRFERNDGGYVNTDSGGYQVLMNYRGDHRQFESVSMTAVLSGQLTEAQVRDRIVLVGSTAISLNDLFYLPPSGDQQVPGVYVHAHLISQILQASLDGRPFLKTVPDYVEGLWTLLWVAATIGATRSIFYSKSLKSDTSAWRVSGRLIGVSSGLIVASYGAFLCGWWLPLVLPLAAMASTMVMGLVYRQQQLQNLAAFDELTQVANRRYFDQYLASALKVHQRLALILCDVDFFKAYNDRYGHPAGDRCLQQVAHAIERAVRDSDLVARYGGEEFVIVLPDSTPETSADIATRIQEQVRQLEIGHEGSQISEWVTLSYGSASVSPGFSLPSLRLVEYADQALYEAKQAGRNRVVVSEWQRLEGDDSCPIEAA